MPRSYKTAPTTHEDALFARGLRYVAGVDEAGRGPLAGPVVAAAVVFEAGVVIEGVNDSKKVAHARRVALAGEIKQRALAYGFGIIPSAEIDATNILQAALRAMTIAVENCAAALGTPIQYALIDGNMIPPLPCPAQAIVKGDAHSHAIAAAAILAKVARDAIMDELHEVYPQYGFAAHKGYGTAAHLEALREYGACAAHRKTFKGVL